MTISKYAPSLQNPAPPDLADGWPVSAPTCLDMDAAVLHGIGPHFDAWKEARVHAVVVARRGTLVYERYFVGEDWRWMQKLGTVAFNASVRHDIRSISKSVTSLMFGIARARGWVGELDTPVIDCLPQYADLRTPGWQSVTLAHLLTMSVGLDWNEKLAWDNPANNERGLDDAADPYRYVLERPTATAPGRFFQYCGGAPTLLQGIMQTASDKALDVIARENLFEPLGIDDVEWIRFPNGDAKGFGGLRLRARDLAKIGQLILDRGSWNGRQVIPAEWIAESTAAHINGADIFFYGYQWWLGRNLVDRREITWVAGLGHGGQRLYIIPAFDLVVAVYAGSYSSTSLVGEIVLKNYVFPAILR